MNHGKERGRVRQIGNSCFPDFPKSHRGRQELGIAFFESWCPSSAGQSGPCLRSLLFEANELFLFYKNQQQIRTKLGILKRFKCATQNATEGRHQVQGDSKRQTRQHRKRVELGVFFNLVGTYANLLTRLHYFGN